MGQKCSEDDIHVGDVAYFQPVPSHLPDIGEEVVRDLSHGQNLLYRYIKAIESGGVSEDLAGQIPCPPSHAH